MLETTVALLRKIFHRYTRRPFRRWAYRRREARFTVTTRDGLRFELDPHQLIDEEIASDGIYERRFLTCFESILPRGAVMLDIGANIGNHALFLSRICSQVHCFEPNPSAITRLERNIALNGARNVHVHKVGLGNADACLPFSINRAGNLGGSGFFERRNEDFEQVELAVRRADDAIEELQLERLDFIKIDVEGFEVEVFEGLHRTIKRFRPLIAFEHHAHEAGPGAFDAIRSQLPQYVIVELAHPLGAAAQALHTLRYGDRIGLLPLEMPELRSYPCLLAVPEERQPELISRVHSNRKRL